MRNSITCVSIYIYLHLLISIDSILSGVQCPQDRKGHHRGETLLCQYCCVQWLHLYRVYTVHCTAYTHCKHSTVYAHCVQYSVHCTLHTVHFCRCEDRAKLVDLAVI